MELEEALTRPQVATCRSPSVTVNGRIFNSLKQLANAYGVPHTTVYRRWQHGWPDQDIAYGRSKNKKKERKRGSRWIVIFRGNAYKNQNQLCVAHGVKFSTFRKRRYSGWSLEQALGIDYRQDRRGGVSSNSGGVPVVVAGVPYSSRAACARAFGLKPHTVGNRLRQGWTPEQVVGIHPPPHGEKRSPVMIAGRQFRSQQAAAEHYGVPINTYRERRRTGWTVEQAVGLVQRGVQ